MKDRVLGLDSGGSKTIAVVVDRSGAVVDIGFGAGLDPTADDAWETRLRALLAPLMPVDMAVLGLPFHGEMAAVSARQTALTKDLLGPQALVMNDVAVAFEAALGGEDGVLILAGTGSMAWARGSKGTTRSGGWGDAFGDEGSAYWIGREALALVSCHLDGRKSCESFACSLLAALGIGPDDLIDFAYTGDSPRAKIASAARHVSDLAALGNTQALGLMQEAALHLAALGHAAARTCAAVTPLRWSFAGGVFNDATVTRTVAAQMGALPVPARFPPVGGAVLVAARQAGWTVDDAFTHRLNLSLLSHIQPQEVTS